VTSFSDTIHALHVFDNNGLLATGLNYITYVNPTGGVVLPSQPNSTALATVNGNMRAVYCHDHTDGYAAGDNYKWYTIEAVPDPVTKIWTGFTIAAYTPADATLGTQLPNVKALAYASRSRGVWGGNNNATSYVRYANDLRNRISARFFYDRLGRIVVSQNSRQQLQNRFSYSLYDALGRVIEAGEKTENTPGTNVLAFAQIFGAYVGGNLVPSVIDDTKLETWLNTQANTTRKEITRSYYDKTHTSILAQLPSSFTPDPLTQRKRIVHVTYEAVYDSNDATYNHATHYDYDIHGNVKTLLQDNADLGALNQLASQRFKRMDYTFDLISGNVHRVDYETNKADQWHHAYSYDADNRITAVYTTSATPLVNDPLAMSSLQNEPLLNPTWEKEAAYSYYAHGPLARTVIGEQEVQGLDYVYTLQGWIKGVNSNNLDANNDPGKDGLGLSANHRVAQDVMGYSLHYFNNDYLPIVNGNTTFIADQSNSDMLQNSSDLYNGNIARMVTTITDPNSRAVLPLGNAYQYDQLNRLKHAVSFDQLNGNAWAGGAPAKYENSFTYDANGNILTQTRNDDNNQVIDELAYFYPKNAANKTVRNRLLYVSDNVDYDASDIDPGMATSNYTYDEEGRLIKDLQEGIEEIKWRVDGKVKSIKQSDNKQGEFSLSFDYDAMGHRIAKHSYDKDQAYNNGLGQLVKSTYYVLDAQGNTMATYERSIDNGQTSLTFAQTEKFIYGSARLGVQNVNIGLLGSQNNTYTQTTVAHRIGKKGFELSNHLGNVLSVISDKVIPHSNGATVDYWLADINQSTDFSAFHAPLIGRTLYKSNNTLVYRYGGSNGQEKTDEVAGNGNHYTAEYWEYDTRLGRRWNLDPVMKEYESPYACFANNPIWLVDLNGADSSLYNSATGAFITKGVTPQDDKTAIWTVDPLAKGYDKENPWKTAQKLTYTVGGDTKEKGVKGFRLRKNHPLAGKGWKAGGQVFEEDLLDMTKEFNNTVNKWKPSFERIGKEWDAQAQKMLECWFCGSDAYTNMLIGKKAAFVGLVGPNMPFDLKSQTRGNLQQIPSYAAVIIGQYSFYKGRLMNFDDYGNTAYGAWGRSYGYGISTLTLGADIDQFFHTGSGDPGRDQYFISFGYYLFK
jgi:hypothetical protein